MNQGCVEARNKLLESFYPLISSISKKFYNNNRHIDFEDFRQEGYLKLLDIIEKWNPDRGALSTIIQVSINNYFKDIIYHQKYNTINGIKLTIKAARDLSKIRAGNDDGISKKRKLKLQSASYTKRLDSDSIYNIAQKDFNDPIDMSEILTLAKENLNDSEQIMFYKTNGINGFEKQTVSSIARELNIDRYDVQKIVYNAKNKMKNALKKYLPNY